VSFSVPVRSVRVLVPYIATYYGGVRRVLESGLPLLSRTEGLRVTYAELCRNGGDMDAMERSGVAVDRSIGVSGPSAFSRGPGLSRVSGILAGLPRLAAIARNLARGLAQFDVCYVHGVRELAIAVAARRMARSRSAPALVWHWHGPPLSLSGPGGPWAEARLVRAGSRSCARVLVVSEFCAGQIRRMGVDPQRVVTVCNATSVDAARATPAPPLPRRPPGAFAMLVACASLRRHKGVHLAIEALGRLPAHHVLWVTGDVADSMAREYVDELEALAARTGVAGRVHFIGARRDVHAVMAAADLVLVPSVWEEPFGLVAAEAQVLGVPVIASSRGALPELMGAGRFGLVFEPDDPAALAAAIARLAADAGERAALARTARTHAAARYSYQRWSREVAAVLTEVAGAPVVAGGLGHAVETARSA